MTVFHFGCTFLYVRGVAAGQRYKGVAQMGLGWHEKSEILRQSKLDRKLEALKALNLL